MNRKLWIGLIVTLLSLFCVSAFAQEPRKGHGIHPGNWNRECVTLEMLELSANQMESVKRIDERFKDRIFQLRNKLMLKRVELRDLLRDPAAEKDAIQAKAREMRGLREALQQEMIDYQIRLRDILTPEQLRHWCTIMGAPWSRGGWKSDSWCR